MIGHLSEGNLGGCLLFICFYLPPCVCASVCVDFFLCVSLSLCVKFVLVCSEPLGYVHCVMIYCYILQSDLEDDTDPEESKLQLLIAQITPSRIKALPPAVMIVDVS